MTEELKQAISALQCAKRGHCDHAMADEAIAALERALAQPAAQATPEPIMALGESLSPEQLDELWGRYPEVRRFLVEKLSAKATPEPVDWKPIKTSKGGREAVRNFFRSTLKRHDFDDYITGALAADFACVLGGYLQAMNTAATPEPVQPRTFDARNAQFREHNWQIRFDAAVDARRLAQERLYSERERHTAEVKRLQLEIGRLTATPEPVGEALQFPPMPEGWPARFRCDSCDGNGEIGELVSMGHFQPPERQTCPDCGGRGWTSEEHAFNADHMREFAEAHALLTRPAPGVPEGFALVPVEPTLEMLKAMESQWLVGSQVDMANREYAAMLAAAQAKGADK